MLSFSEDKVVDSMQPMMGFYRMPTPAFYGAGYPSGELKVIIKGDSQSFDFQLPEHIQSKLHHSLIHSPIDVPHANKKKKKGKNQPNAPNPSSAPEEPKLSAKQLTQKHQELASAIKSSPLAFDVFVVVSDISQELANREFLAQTKAAQHINNPRPNHKPKKNQNKKEDGKEDENEDEAEPVTKRFDRINLVHHAWCYPMCQPGAKQNSSVYAGLFPLVPSKGEGNKKPDNAQESKAEPSQATTSDEKVGAEEGKETSSGPRPDRSHESQRASPPPPPLGLQPLPDAKPSWLPYGHLRPFRVSVHSDRRDPWVMCCSPNNCALLVDTTQPLSAFWSVSHKAKTPDSSSQPGAVVVLHLISHMQLPDLHTAVQRSTNLSELIALLSEILGAENEFIRALKSLFRLD